MAQRMALLAVVALAVFLLPYLVPVKPSVSLAYVAGFSNRAAVLLLLLGGAAFAFFTRGRFARLDQRNSPLTVRSLVPALGAILAVCLARLHFIPVGARMDEAFFFLDRQQLLAVGRAPFSQFDFPYGPLLLYPGLWIAHLFDRSQTFGYGAWWAVQWLLGTAMLWAVVRRLDLAVRRRVFLFLFLLLIQCETLRAGGSNYTPFRAYNAAFLVVAAHWVWERSRNPWLLALASAGGVLLATLCSMEQGIGVAFGLGLYLLLLTFAERVFPSQRALPALALVLYLAGCAASFACADYLGMFISFRSFTSGGYADPLLASPVNCLVLLAYVVAGCVLYRRLAQGQLDSVSIPLVLAGCAMLPAALGRCDTQHICAATPAFVVGAAAIAAAPAMRRWWMPLALLNLFFLPPLLLSQNRLIRRLTFRDAVQPQAASALTGKPVEPAPNALFDDATLPCRQPLFSPAVAPSPVFPIHPACLERGFFFTIQDVVTPAAVEQKVAELRSRPSVALLLLNQPLEQTLRPDQVSLELLYHEELSFYVPKARKPPVTYEPIIRYIETHYTPGPTLLHGQFRVWTPNR